MADLTTISSALSSLKAATDIAKLIIGSKDYYKDAETKFQLAELISSLANTKLELAEIQSLLLSKQKEINELKAQLELKSKITWDPPYYWVGSIDDKDGPYCQNCFDDKSKLIRLQGNGSGYWSCLSCEKGYKDSTYKEPQINISPNRRSSFWDR